MSAAEEPFGRSPPSHRMIEHLWPGLDEQGDEGGPLMMG